MSGILDKPVRLGLTGAVVALAMIGGTLAWSGRGPTSDPNPPAAADGCAAATDAFHRRYDGAKGVGGALVGKVERACRRPDGSLRFEADLAADLALAWPPTRVLCTALSDFVASGGRTWNGFTVYSTHRLSPGDVVLIAAEPDRCGRPVTAS